MKMGKSRISIIDMHIYSYILQSGETELGPGPSGDTFLPVFKSNDLYRLGVNYICARPVT